jgi:hypothetical protein
MTTSCKRSSTQSAPAAGKGPGGAARDMIRATLNLPPGHRIGKAEARQAVLMALMGSCHASSLAKFLHDHMPRKLARDLKALVEDNLVTVRNGNTLIDIPLHVFSGEDKVQEKVVVSEDGCLSDASPLHAVPGVRAALTALGMQADEMPDAVTAALRRMKLRGGDQSLSFGELIENIATHGADPARADRRTAAAMDAFAGVEHVMLLRSWESTFASAAHNSIASRHKDKLRRAVIHGTADNSKQEPVSLASKAAQCQARLASVDARYKSTAIEHLRQEFIWQIDALMDERLQLFFDAGKPAYLGMSALPNDAGLSRRIQSADDFNSMMKEILQQAEINTNEILRQLGDAGDFSLGALRLIADHLTQYVDKPDYNDFLKNVASQFVAGGASANEEAMRELPWKLGVGRQLADLAAIYFGKTVNMTSSEQSYPPNPDKPKDAAHIMHFVLNTLWSMKNDIRSEVERSPDSFYVPVAVHDHVFSLTPGTFIHDWTGHQTCGQWIEERLKAPARAHVLAARTEPPLGELLSHVAALMDCHKNGYGIPQVPKDELALAIKAVSAVEQDDDGAYTLQGVYQALSAPGVYSPAAEVEEFLDCVATAILQVEPPLAVQFADTHLPSPTRWGGTDRLGALYNPFRDTINIHCTDDVNDGHGPVKQEWLESPWHIMTTPLHDAGDTQAAGQ